MTLTEIGIIIEDTLRIKQLDDGEYQIYFSKLEILEDGFLIASYGHGRTKTAAKKDYAEDIAGKIIVINARRYSRLELQLPPKITIR